MQLIACSLPLHQLPETTLMNTPILSINAASKSFPLSVNSTPSLLHSSYCSSCAAGVINCAPPGVKQRKSGSLTAKKEHKNLQRATLERQSPDLGKATCLCAHVLQSVCSDFISGWKRKKNNLLLIKLHEIKFNQNTIIQVNYASAIVDSGFLRPIPILISEN